jgi:maltooligosyltrehalose trehalohydrolase
MSSRYRLGAVPTEAGTTRFLVWAPRARSVAVRLEREPPRTVPLAPSGEGYFSGEVDRCGPGERYRYVLDGARTFADPASRRQPLGVEGPSEVTSDAPAPVTGRWGSGRPLSEYVFYELHVGCFSRAGTFAGVVPQLARLREVGVTAVELMPVSPFPGRRNWGYDGVFPYGVHEGYGGPGELKSLVQALHDRGFAAVLDVVFNHLGPEGNVLGAFGPYFTDTYRSPWGEGINFDGKDSGPVRRYFRECALRFLEEFSFDALRLDAVHAIVDRSPVHFLRELQQAVERLSHRLGRRLFLIAESDLNDPRLIRPRREGGYGLAAQWNDDFHHALHAWLTGERDGYYQDFGPLPLLAKAFREGYVFTGQRSRFRGRRHGRPTVGLRPGSFVVYDQDHDQVGNRRDGERLVRLVDPGRARIALGLTLLNPFLPLLFMGEEYGERRPFLFFSDYQGPALARAVREGRSREFASFRWAGPPPDPQAEATFRASRLTNPTSRRGSQRRRLAYCRELLRVRSETASHALVWPDAAAGDGPEGEWLTVRFPPARHGGLLVVALPRGIRPVPVPVPPGPWAKRLDSEEPRWGGRGPAAPSHLRSDRAASTLSSGRGLTFWRPARKGGS